MQVPCMQMGDLCRHSPRRRRHGRGKLSAPGGYRYDGEWAGDAQEGEGACHTEAGDKYKGVCGGGDWRWVEGRGHGGAEG